MEFNNFVKENSMFLLNIYWLHSNDFHESTFILLLPISALTMPMQICTAIFVLLMWETYYANIKMCGNDQCVNIYYPLWSWLNRGGQKYPTKVREKRSWVLGREYVFWSHISYLLIVILLLIFVLSFLFFSSSNYARWCHPI